MLHNWIKNKQTNPPPQSRRCRSVRAGGRRAQTHAPWRAPCWGAPPDRTSGLPLPGGAAGWRTGRAEAPGYGHGWRWKRRAWVRGRHRAPRERIGSEGAVGRDPAGWAGGWREACGPEGCGEGLSQGRGLWAGASSPGSRSRPFWDPPGELPPSPSPAPQGVRLEVTVWERLAVVVSQYDYGVLGLRGRELMLCSA